MSSLKGYGVIDPVSIKIMPFLGLKLCTTDNTRIGRSVIIIGAIL
jgi:hypothetical protein